MKEVIVNIIPSCISYNREKQHMECVKRAYLTKNYNDICVQHMEIVEETEEVAVINYYTSPNAKKEVYGWSLYLVEGTKEEKLGTYTSYVKAKQEKEVLEEVSLSKAQIYLYRTTL
jgi:hypothetical protein